MKPREGFRHDDDLRKSIVEIFDECSMLGALHGDLPGRLREHVRDDYDRLARRQKMKVRRAADRARRKAERKAQDKRMMLALGRCPRCKARAADHRCPG